MSSRNDFRDKIYACECDVCRSVVRLVEEKGAVLQFSPARAGRLCELAVVAASGNQGLTGEQVVDARRRYADHLGISLMGPVSDADGPAHIQHALDNSNHNPSARSRINLGRAVASFDGTHYRLG